MEAIVEVPLDVSRYDAIEESLREIADKLRDSWTNNRCQSCPIGELAALAAAVLTFYREQKG